MIHRKNQNQDPNAQQAFGNFKKILLQNSIWQKIIAKVMMILIKSQNQYSIERS